MTLYDGWQLYIPDSGCGDEEGRDRSIAVGRRAVARGEALVTFYNTRFGINLNQQEMGDLVAFLKTL